MCPDMICSVAANGCFILIFFLVQVMAPSHLSFWCENDFDKKLPLQIIYAFRNVLFQYSRDQFFQPTELTQCLSIFKVICVILKQCAGKQHWCLIISSRPSMLQSTGAQNTTRTSCCWLWGWWGGWMKRRVRPAQRGETCQLYTGKTYMFWGSTAKINTQAHRVRKKVLRWFTADRN